jgi:hypothetical protein
MLTKEPLHWLEQWLFDSTVEKILQIVVCDWPHRRRWFWVVNFDETFHPGEDLAFVTECSTFEESIFVSIFLDPERIRLLADAVKGNDVHTLMAAVAEIKTPLNDVTLLNLKVRWLEAHLRDIYFMPHSLSFRAIFLLLLCLFNNVNRLDVDQI